MRLADSRATCLVAFLLAIGCGKAATGEPGVGAAGSTDSGGSTSGGSTGDAGATSNAGATSGGSTEGGGSTSSAGSTESGGSTSGGSTGDAGSTSNAGAGSTGGATAGLVECDPAKVLCKRAAPACATGEVPSVLGNCYGDCVKIESCACSAPEQCPQPNQYTCWSKQHCGYFVR